jgi:DNA repair photolyase
VYCYASSYIPNFADCRPKKELLSTLKREAKKLRGEVISISNSSDPYPRIEATAGLTRRCLEILAESNCKIQVITKSNLVVRDDDLLSRTQATVAFTITTDDENIAKILEPAAPSVGERLRAAQELIHKGIPVSARVDPIVPLINDQPEKLIKTLAAVGVKHITSSTYKVKPDNWRRFCQAFPAVAEKLKPLYFQEGEKIGGSILLPRDLRYKLMKNTRDLATANGMKFGVCRENLTQLNTAPCDGSWLLNTTRR